ncbi:MULTISPECIES: type I restriction enzyme HsdR N-terminal domain-containing protein [unclassified Imperialibacter]|uniref:type I restriction enzyme HsdR N-terminal domain-containing protein n=1 Tax=unclassified Imperialibacter TaxID=2629706 RepID=UPI00125BCADD|nr:MULTISPECIES: type I restriction enzyme HsdR N-terminal domain-containing protein [unclassified Imperialibacter]CAD5278267.1 Restriction endonuclease subunit R [Imperialibacter sp. 89]CAD5292436.1 Restriction endonuclease subunit R [Imperialibacter sp. 75]VVS99795.1 Restriction endonuclease subunit R [Imperialibacter sp. EC-SDR9]
MSKETRPLVIEKDGQTLIYDLLRRKYLVWTPEEAVRQQMVNYLMAELHYPKGLMSIEAGLHYNKRQKRTDLVVYNNTGKPHILVECKAPDVKLSRETIFQVATYNKELDANILVITNGNEMICLQVERERNNLVSLSDIPPYK